VRNVERIEPVSPDLDYAGRPAGGERLGDPILARPLGYSEMTAIRPDQLDGIVS
jgi:hypothetical protein